MIKPDPHNWEAMAIQAQAEFESAKNELDNLQQQVYGLEEDVEKLKAVVEYLEMKLGINDPI
jgi:multidrug resistance efflux pump